MWKKIIFRCFNFFVAACYIKWKLQLLFIGLLQMIWSRSRTVEEPHPSLHLHHKPHMMCVCVCVRGVWQPFGSLSNELKLCIDAFWANNLHRNRTWRGSYLRGKKVWGTRETRQLHKCAFRLGLSVVQLKSLLDLFWNTANLEMVLSSFCFLFSKDILKT